MTCFFEKVKRFADTDLPMPTRATKESAGYDLYVAEDITVPPYDFLVGKIRDHIDSSKSRNDYFGFINAFSIDDVAKITKETKTRPTLVSTGMKCKLGIGQYLELSLRSSTPLKYWLIMANGVGK